MADNTVTPELQDLATQVKSNTDLEASAVTLLNGLSAKVAATAGDPAAAKALSDQLSASAAGLAAAVTANTPAAPPDGGTGDTPASTRR